VLGSKAKNLIGGQLIGGQAVNGLRLENLNHKKPKYDQEQALKRCRCCCAPGTSFLILVAAATQLLWKSGEIPSLKLQTARVKQLDG
jgi:hypothetical protein